jgi:hypothetical protein
LRGSVIKALGYRLQEKAIGGSNLPLAACSRAVAGTGRSEVHWLSKPELDSRREPSWFGNGTESLIV